jgi:hypothetical protein
MLHGGLMGQKLAEFLDFLQGFRKFIVMLLLIVVGIVFRLENLISGTDFVTLLQGTAIAFMASNAVENIGSTVKAWIANKTNNIDSASSS